jgi:hypothetical protein
VAVAFTKKRKAEVESQLESKEGSKIAFGVIEAFLMDKWNTVPNLPLTSEIPIEQ